MTYCIFTTWYFNSNFNVILMISQQLKQLNVKTNVDTLRFI
jgi:hypothetical protein